DERRPLRRAVNERRRRQERQRLVAALGQGRQLARIAERRAAGIAALQPGEEHVLVAPHHAARHAGGAAGVDDVAVVARAPRKIARRRRRRQRRLVLAADGEPVLQRRDLGGDRDR